MHADTSFRNGSGASMKWRETFESIVWTPIVYIAYFQVLSGCLQWSLNCYRSSFSFTLACHRSSLVKKVSLWKKNVVKFQKIMKLMDVYKAETFLFLFPIKQLNVQSWVKFFLFEHILGQV